MLKGRKIQRINYCVQKIFQILISRFWCGGSQKGVALYLSLAILAILLAIALGISAITFGQLRTLTAIGHSVTAFYAANSGMERELYEKNYQTQSPGYSYAGLLDLDGDGGSVSSCPADLSDENDACYQVTIVSVGPTVLRSAGYYKNVRRALEISF